MEPERVRQAMECMVREVQDEICAACEALDGARFREDAWRRGDGGGGLTRVLEGGAVFERAAVNSSVVWGTLGVEAMRGAVGWSERGADPRFFAAGLSVVIHPRNPFAPTAHCNVRHLQRGEREPPVAWWFGGGADLTPYYLFEDDARHFHGVLKAACDRHDPALYPRCKRACDEYFSLPHRGERRGVGGIFFDDLHDRPAGELLAFVADCARAFVPAYLPIVARRKDTPYGEAERLWQEVRRSRYVEFNLVHDRGTAFGLATGGARRASSSPFRGSPAGSTTCNPRLADSGRRKPRARAAAGWVGVQGGSWG